MNESNEKQRIGDEQPWDHFSDQPLVIRDKQYKRDLRKQYFFDHLKTLVVSCLVFPISLILWPLFRKKHKLSPEFFALCVNLDKGDEQVKYVEELGCKSIQVRLYLSEVDRLDEYVAFIQQFKQKKILLTVIQSKLHINDSKLLANDIKQVFAKLSPWVDEYQIGTTINRSKWGFFSMQQYFQFYKTVQLVRDEFYPNLRLLGPSVIDFEYHYVMRALFTSAKVRFDALAMLLYVDRRGAPENKQMFLFDTQRKISYLYALMGLSSKTSNQLHLTEANWPLENTAPWAPTSAKECINEADYANYLLRYYLSAMASQRVLSVHWHQLMANGYGLIDMRDGVRKREAFYVFKTMLKHLENVQVESYSTQQDVFHLGCFNAQEDKKVHVLWCNQTSVSLQSHAEQTGINLTDVVIFDKVGNPLSSDTMITDSPIYLIDELSAA